MSYFTSARAEDHARITGEPNNDLQPFSQAALIGASNKCHQTLWAGGQVEIAAELVHELDAGGKQLRVVKLTDYTAEKVRTLCASSDEQAVPPPNGGRAQAPERGIDFPTVAAQAGKMQPYGITR